MALNLKPLGSRVVIEPIEQEEITAGGIVLPETAKEKPQQGNVLAVGPGDRDEDGKRIAMDVAVGDKVLFAKYSGTEIKVDGKKLLILRESDILAIVEVNNLNWRNELWLQNNSFFQKTPAGGCSKALIWLPMPSAPPLAPRAATWPSTASSAPPPSPMTA